MENIGRSIFVPIFLLLFSASVAFGQTQITSPASASDVSLKDIEELEKAFITLKTEVKFLKEEVDSLRERIEILGHFPLPKQIIFCGKDVPLERWYVRQELEQQLFYLNRERAQVVLWMKRSGKFFPHVAEELKKADLPDCLKYLMVVESGLLEKAYSKAGASGLWQFIKSTGRKFNLRYTDDVDERRDFEKATAAAIKHLQKLYEKFQDWPLAMAAYNAGEKKVHEALKEQKTTEYWELLFEKRSVLTETNFYVYKIVAVNLLFENPRAFGFSINGEDLFTAPETETVRLELKRPTRLTNIAQSYGTTLLELKKLNPKFRRNFLNKGTWDIIIPKTAIKDPRTK